MSPNTTKPPADVTVESNGQALTVPADVMRRNLHTMPPLLRALMRDALNRRVFSPVAVSWADFAFLRSMPAAGSPRPAQRRGSRRERNSAVAPDQTVVRQRGRVRRETGRVSGAAGAHRPVRGTRGAAPASHRGAGPVL
jgi:hypothetical protein